MQGCRGGEDDGKRDRIREPHTGKRICTDALEGFGCLVWRPDQRPLETVDPLVLGLLRGLPEKQVGRYGCPEDRKQGREEFVAPNDARDKETEQGFTPGNLDRKQGRNIGEETQGHPFQQRDIAGIGHKHDRDHRGAS